MTEYDSDREDEFVSYEGLMVLPVLTLAWLYAMLQLNGFDWAVGDA